MFRFPVDFASSVVEIDQDRLGTKHEISANIMLILGEMCTGMASQNFADSAHVRPRIESNLPGICI